LPRGKGLRCSGYLGHDGAYAHCSREDLAGGLSQEQNETYAHRLEGPCKCGETHGEAAAVYREPRPVNGAGNGKSNFHEVARWEYEGGLVVVRAEDEHGGKTFWQRHRLADGSLEKGAGAAPRTLYRAADVRAAEPEQFIWLVEGEKCADAMRAAGFLATTTPGGAGAWSKAAELASGLLRGHHVVILPDHDTAGAKYAIDAKSTLERVCKSLRVLELPDIGDGEDVADWLARGGQPDDLVRLAEAQPDVLAKARILVASDAAITLWARPLPPAIPTGIIGLDHIITGMRAESFIVLNGPPGRGKSGFTIQVSRTISLLVPVLYLSSELSERQVLARAAAQVLLIPWSRIFGWGPSEAGTVSAALRGFNLRVVRIRRGQSIIDILNRVADEAGRAPVLVLDYLQHAARRLAIQDPRIAVGQLVDDIGTWACDTRSTGLVVSSVSRGNYRHDDDATAEDFLGAGKEAGEIECDASAELFLKTESPPEGGSAPAKLHISKHRFGASGQTVGLIFDGAVGAFRDDPSASLSELEREVYLAVHAGERSQESIRARAEVKKERATTALRSLVRQGWIEGPPYRVLREIG